MGVENIVIGNEILDDAVSKVFSKLVDSGKIVIQSSEVFETKNSKGIGVNVFYNGSQDEYIGFFDDVHNIFLDDNFVNVYSLNICYSRETRRVNIRVFEKDPNTTKRFEDNNSYDLVVGVGSYIPQNTEFSK